MRVGAGSEGYQKIIHLGFHCWLRSDGSIVWAGQRAGGVDIDNARRYDRCGVDIVTIGQLRYNYDSAAHRAAGTSLAGHLQ